MKDFKIGKLLISKKAILLIAFCLFLNGMVIGAFVALNEKAVNHSINLLIVFTAIFIPYIMFFKSIKKNIAELK